MQHVAPLASPRESIFAVLASTARKLSYRDLSAVAAASGAAALVAAAMGRASWMLLSACYVVWCFAGWGILFHTTTPRTARWRAFQWTIVGSASVVAVILGVGVFFWALGPSWKL
jgi:hypothetical protein